MQLTYLCGSVVLQVGYNKDGVFLTFIHNCPSNQETATGAMIYALPKWAVYKGATYFWSPVWTAWDVFDAVGQKNNDDYYPGAFIQMQPVIPQRAVDVQADVTYFVSDVSDTEVHLPTSCMPCLFPALAVFSAV